MSHTIHQFVAGGLLLSGMLVAAGCEPKRIPPMTVTDLMEDRVTLDGVLLKCNQNPDKARNDMDCLNARIAIERLAKDVDPREVAKRNEEFERSRERLRQAQERARADQESKAKVDPYNMPVVPVDPAPAGKDPTVASQPRP
jgi:hypothetical protein